MKKILLIEDDDTLGKNLKLFFEENDYEVLIGKNGKDGLEILSNMDSKPHIIISDIMMPILDGYDFYIEVTKNREWNDIPFIFLSGKNKPDDVKFGKLLGVDDYITKPFNLSDLLEMVNNKIDEYIRSKKADQILEKKLKDFIKIEDPVFNKLAKIKFVYIFCLRWNKEEGPNIIDFYPKNEISSLNLKSLILNLYESISSLYDFKAIFQSDLYYLRISKGFVNTFNLIKFIEPRGSDLPNKSYMICIVTPNFHYLQFQRFKEILVELLEKIEANKSYYLSKYWDKLLELT
ncbi:MAG: response regulator [Candidatus Lokiarchaeota archaeon]|nr:response regulator [Candidatus Lokiarchaeota archaeon]